jgi:DNA-binding MarR family transcriptional regulator
MKVKEENKEKFAAALSNVVRAIKNETEHCGKLCGGLNEKEMTVIVFVGERQHVKMSDIADNIAAPMSTLTNVVDKLVEKKLLNRDHSIDDRRVINVSLATDGKAAYKSLLGQKKKVAERALSNLSEKDQALMIKYLGELAQAFSSK